RPGRRAVARRADRPRRRLPHRPQELLLPPGKRRRPCRYGRTDVVRPQGSVQDSVMRGRRFGRLRQGRRDVAGLVPQPADMALEGLDLLPEVEDGGVEVLDGAVLIGDTLLESSDAIVVGHERLSNSGTRKKPAMKPPRCACQAICMSPTGSSGTT